MGSRDVIGNKRKMEERKEKVVGERAGREREKRKEVKGMGNGNGKGKRKEIINLS